MEWKFILGPDYHAAANFLLLLPSHIVQYITKTWNKFHIDLTRLVTCNSSHEYQYAY